MASAASQPPAGGSGGDGGDEKKDGNYWKKMLPKDRPTFKEMVMAKYTDRKVSFSLSWVEWYGWLDEEAKERFMHEVPWIAAFVLASIDRIEKARLKEQQQE